MILCLSLCQWEPQCWFVDLWEYVIFSGSRGLCLPVSSAHTCYPLATRVIFPKHNEVGSPHTQRALSLFLLLNLLFCVGVFKGSLLSARNGVQALWLGGPQLSMTQSPTYLSSFIHPFIHIYNRQELLLCARSCSTCWDMAVVQRETLAFGELPVSLPPSALALPHTCAVTTPVSCEAASPCLPKASTAPSGCKVLPPNETLLYFFKEDYFFEEGFPGSVWPEPSPLLTLGHQKCLLNLSVLG